MFNIYIQIKLLLKSQFIAKFVWVLNNFLTMEFYRKLCNNLYWKRLTPHTASYNTRFWMIIITALSVIWLAFFYNPNDPTNSRSSGFIIFLFTMVFRKSRISFYLFFKNLSRFINHKADLLTLHILNSGNISLWRSGDTYLKTSSLLI